MPGVPTGRGCDACRKQKKKCDLQQPSCSRCARLTIPCTGSGLQRYMFKTQTPAVKKSRKPVLQCQRCPPLTLISHPTNEVSQLVASFISAIGVTDPRYNLSVYMPFSRFIPQRLGINKALDASINAIVVAHSSLYSDTMSLKMLASYGHALRALRTCLNDPTQASSPETLISIYFILICQGWIEGQSTCDNRHISHGEILVHLLSVAVEQGWKDDFAIEVLLTMTVCVLFASTFNPKIKLDPWFPKVLDLYKHADGGLQPTELNLNLRVLGRVAMALQDPDSHLIEIRNLYEMVQADCGRTHLILSPKTDLDWLPQSGVNTQLRSNIQMVELICCYYAAHGLLHSLALVLNAVLRAFDPSDKTLAAESDKYSDEILRITHDVSQYRPLGASFVPITLSTVLAVSDDAGKQEMAESLLQDFSSDFKGIKRLNSAIWLKAVLQNLRYRLAAKKSQILRQGYQADTVAVTPGFEDPPPPPDGGCYVQ